MAAPINPGVVAVNGKDKWAWVPAIADLATPTLAEVTAITGIDLSCFLLSEQGGPSATVNKATLPRLLCETQSFQFISDTTWDMADIVSTVDPQAAANSDGKKAWEALVDNSSGFLVRGLGLGGKEEFDTGDFISIYPADLGTKVLGKSSTDGSAIATFTIGAAITGPPKQLVEIVSGS